MPKQTAKEFCPKNQKEWRAWLKQNHKKEDSVWLVYIKKGFPDHNLSWSEAVDEALCFGWIDSTSNSIDDKFYKQYFCRRNPKSHWSKINKDKLKVLQKHNLIEEAGLKSIEIAKENGSWEFLDDIEALVIPEDLKQALSNSKKAQKYFDELSNSQKKQLLFHVKSAKRPETRERRIKEIVGKGEGG